MSLSNVASVLSDSCVANVVSRLERAVIWECLNITRGLCTVGLRLMESKQKYCCVDVDHVEYEPAIFHIINIPNGTNHTTKVFSILNRVHILLLVYIKVFAKK